MHLEPAMVIINQNPDLRTTEGKKSMLRTKQKQEETRIYSERRAWLRTTIKSNQKKNIRSERNITNKSNKIRREINQPRKRKTRDGNTWVTIKQQKQGKIKCGKLNICVWQEPCKYFLYHFNFIGCFQENISISYRLLRRAS